MKLSIHEDDEGQISLDLLSNYKLNNGYEWDNGLPVFSFADDRDSFTSLDLSLTEIVGFVEKYLPPITKVTTGFGNHFTELKNTASYGYGKHCAIFIEHQGDLVENVWFFIDSLSSKESEMFMGLLAEFGNLGDFIICSNEAQADCKNKEHLLCFLNTEH